ncbi:sulfatase [Neotamlana laminarinivorans]|uniref:Sulfatase n=1 Tax=Neotamlana laminarinivorans TaxID=2883124 RepID=A0A9X1L1M1_9FLAO|nr:sulfatase [Tamlana laminarinivorans]MCB4798840.1 sulfatase [Tamlana laminarinivorans]
MKIKNAINYLMVLIFVGFIFSCKTSGKTTPPNIILIMADDLGYGELSCYGSPKVKTPNLDKLASQGVKFLDFHANGPVCSPTRAALMTGKYQQRTGVEGVITAVDHREVGLSLNELTMAEAMKNQGYTTAMYGKWHLGYAEPYNPIYQGFDDFRGFVSGNIDYHSHIDQAGYLDWWVNNKVEDEPGYTTDLITKYASKFIKENSSKKTRKPFFLYLAQEAPHYPIQGRNDKPLRKEGSGKFIRKVPKDSVPVIYTEMIELMDKGIGDIMKTLDAEGLSENTIVVFCSDNGPAGKRGDSGGLRAAKTSIYEGGHRVPAIVRYPKKIKAGSVSNETVLTMDLLPTFIDFSEGKSNIENFDGISIKNHLVNEENLPNRDVFWSFKGHSAIRNSEWKLLEILSKESIVYELYNLETDLSETKNLAAENPDKVEALKKRLNLWKTNVRQGVNPVAE